MSNFVMYYYLDLWKDLYKFNFDRFLFEIKDVIL